jgi:hypothetical protein
MEDGSQPEYAFAGVSRSSMERFDIPFHLSSGERSSVAVARSATSMAFLLSSGESTWVFNIPFHLSSGERSFIAVARSATSMASLLLSSGESTWVKLEAVNVALLSSSGESTLEIEGYSAVSMALLLNSRKSTLLGLENLKRAEQGKERGDA